jgi:integral membrane sensor domain MASE1
MRNRYQLQLRRCAKAGLLVLGVAAAYFLSARLGIMLGLVRGEVSPFFPPTGISLVALLILGVRVWPGIYLGAFLTNVMIVPPLPAALTAVGATLGAVFAFLLLRRVGFRVELDRLRDALALVFLAAFAGTLVSATIGSLLRVVGGATSASNFLPTWLSWWTGDAMGVLVFAPLLLALRSMRMPPHVNAYRWIEAAALLAGTFVVVLAEVRLVGTLFLAFPFLGWAALRFGLAGTTAVALIASIIGIDSAVHGIGLFGEENLDTQMLTLQLFNGSVALSGLLLAVTITQRDRANSEIAHATVQLGEVVSLLGRSRNPPEVKVPRQGDQQRHDVQRPEAHKSYADPSTPSARPDSDPRDR